MNRIPDELEKFGISQDILEFLKPRYLVPTELSFKNTYAFVGQVKFHGEWLDVYVTAEDKKTIITTVFANKQHQVFEIPKTVDDFIMQKENMDSEEFEFATAMYQLSKLTSAYDYSWSKYKLAITPVARGK